MEEKLIIFKYSGCAVFNILCLQTSETAIIFDMPSIQVAYTPLDQYFKCLLSSDMGWFIIMTVVRVGCFHAFTLNQALREGHCVNKLI